MEKLTDTSAPFAATDLQGFTIGQAFLRTVLNDPAVLAHRAGLIVEDEKWVDVFATGRFPYWLPDHRWPIVTTAEHLVQVSLEVSYFEKLANLNQGLPLARPKPSNELCQACKAIVDRLTSFFEFLAGGEVDIVDIFGLRPGAAAWSRSGAMINVQTSDYYLDYKQIPFRGLTLQAITGATATPGLLLAPSSKRSGKPGRKRSYDYERLKEDLEKHCASSGRFQSGPEFVTWCVRNAMPRPGCAPPKGAGGHPDRKTIKAAIKEHGLDRIGLADGVTLETGKLISPSKLKKNSRGRNRQ